MNENYHFLPFFFESGDQGISQMLLQMVLPSPHLSIVMHRDCYMYRNKSENYIFFKGKKRECWVNRRDASTASRNQMDELTKKTFHFTLSPCDFRKLKEWSSCDYMSSVLESGHWLKSGRGGRKQENILLRFSCVRLVSSSSFTHLWKVMFSRCQSCPVRDSPLLPYNLAEWSTGQGGCSSAFVLKAVMLFQNLSVICIGVCNKMHLSD